MNVKLEEPFRIVLLIVLFVVMVTTTAAWQQSKSNAKLGTGNRTLLCESVRVRLSAEAHNDPALHDAYERNC